MTKTAKAAKATKATKAIKVDKAVGKARSKAAKDSLDAVYNSTDEEEHPITKPPIQPTISVVDMGHILRPLAFRRHTEWTNEEKGDLAAFMCNRAGINASDKVAMRKAGLESIFEFWLNEYVALYETDREFEKAIDPWQVIVTVRPADNIYLPVLNLANRYIGGDADANNPNQPIQFMHGLNWFLSVQNGKENMRRVLAFMKGHFVAQDIPFQGIVQDYRASFQDA